MARKKHKTNQWTKEQNARRYILHQRIKGEVEYSAKGRVIYITAATSNAGKPGQAIAELLRVFKYNVQYQIREFFIGTFVIINPKFAKGNQLGRVFEVKTLVGHSAVIKPVKGRWRKEVQFKLKELIPVRWKTNL